MNSTNLSPPDHSEAPWYVVWSEARAEKKVADRLTAMGYAVWLPTVTERHRWSDRWKMVTTPLFPGYLFAATGEGYVPLLKTPGVLTLVKEGLRPAEFTTAYIMDLRRVIEDPATAVEALSLDERFVAGDDVLVREGPLAGFRGTVTEVRGSRRLILYISSIGRGLLCTLGDVAVTKVGDSTAVFA